ncbi:SUMF1/EgtB/PvdO family nonheme iron enzyme [bacterium]|nr:SUMF1/EgtB/PvdO family nonheme iron enzyme [bacterium]
MRSIRCTFCCALAIGAALGLAACGGKDAPAPETPSPPSGKPKAKPKAARRPALPAQTAKQAALNFMLSVRDGDRALFLASAHFEDQTILAAAFEAQVAMWAFASKFAAAYGGKEAERLGLPPSLEALETKLAASEERGRTLATLRGKPLGEVRKVSGAWKVDVSHMLPSDRSRALPAVRLLAAAAKQAMARVGGSDHTPEQIVAEFREALSRADRTVEDKPRVDSTLGPMQSRPWRIPDLEMGLVYVKAGLFERKRLQAGSGAKPHVADSETTMLRDGFWIGKHEVTQEQYASVMKSSPSRFKGTRLPVECVSHQDATAFCQKLTERERRAYRLPSGCVYRLPTCVEWEYCCRAGREAPAPANLAEEAWFKDNAAGRTHPVGLRKANPWGIYDMLGNVIEWCGDRSGPRMAAYQGGSFKLEAARCAAGYMWAGSLGFKMPSLGFRVVLAPEKK